jgi:hypothetical protein
VPRGDLSFVVTAHPFEHGLRVFEMLWHVAAHGNFPSAWPSASQSFSASASAI